MIIKTPLFVVHLALSMLISLKLELVSFGGHVKMELLHPFTSTTDSRITTEGCGVNDAHIALARSEENSKHTMCYIVITNI